MSFVHTTRSINQAGNPRSVQVLSDQTSASLGLHLFVAQASLHAAGKPTTLASGTDSGRFDPVSGF